MMDKTRKVEFVNRTMTGILTRMALPVAISLFFVCECMAVNWTNHIGGATDWYWNDNSNWDGDFPNGSGTVANISLDVQVDDMDIDLGQDITIESLVIGDTVPDISTTGFAIVVKGSTNTLIFESAIPGGSTALNLTNSIDMDPWHQESVGFDCDVALGGTSSLTITTHDLIEMNDINFNDNAIIVEGPGTGYLTLSGELTGDSSSHLIHNGDFGINVSKTNLGFNGTVTLNGQKILCAYGGLVKAQTIRIAEGGKLEIGSNSEFDNNPGQRLTTNTLALRGGILNHLGQQLGGAAAGEIVTDSITRIDLERGGSRIQMDTKDGSAGTVLNVEKFAREQGTVLTVAADGELGGNTNITDMGQQILLSDLTGMVGAGGIEGSTTMSIFPWIISASGSATMAGENLTTYGTNGLRELRVEEYATNLSAAGSADNVNPDSMALSSNKTVNAIRLYYDMDDLGNERILTIASGVVLMTSGKDRIGDIGSAEAGILNFGTVEGIVYSRTTHNTGTNTIGAVISGTGGLTKAGLGELLLGGDNDYSGTTTVAEGMLRVGDETLATAECNLGSGNVVVCDDATLRIAENVLDAIDDTVSISLNHDGLLYGKLDLGPGVNERVAALYLAGVSQMSGTYGSSGSGVVFTNDNYFSGAGIITVPMTGTIFVVR